MAPMEHDFGEGGLSKGFHNIGLVESYILLCLQVIDHDNRSRQRIGRAADNDAIAFSFVLFAAVRDKVINLVTDVVI